MISNQILQNTIDGLKNITRREMCVVEYEGKIVATTERENLGAYVEGVVNFIESPAESQLIQGQQFFKVFDNNVCEYIVAIRGEDEETYRIGKIATFQIQNLLIAYKERFDKDNFIKNLLLDNLLLVDIYSRAKKLHVESICRRVVYLIESDMDKEIDINEIIRNIFPSKAKDFITSIDEETIVLVKELRDEDGKEEIEKLAKMMVDSLNMEGIKNVHVSIGNIVNDIKNVSASFKEARMAMEVGKIFDANKNIANYTELGIGRLIYQLPASLCKMFIEEVLHGISIDEIDEETLFTVQKFFENNLNVSETSRQLYIHRNTLVYRLDKILKNTGLDLRNFDDAIIFKITLMVSTYLSYRNKNLRGNEV
ncbi:MAG: PucR family transcriptional regulator [Lachnospirales bacterium]